MTFQPFSGGHSIAEVVFALQFARPFSPAELESLAAAHAEFKSDLPRLNRLSALHVMVGDHQGAALTPLSGISMDRTKPDGNIGWLLKAEQNSILVNCLDYEGGWDAVLPRVMRYLRRSAEILGIVENPIASIVLQYVDIFEWVGPPEEYDATQLLDRKSRYLPEAIWGRGPLWHLHQGWFRYDDIPAPGRLLERIHIDSVSVRASDAPTVRIDTTLAFEPDPPYGQDHLFQPSGASVEHILHRLHGLNKDLLSAYLTADIAKGIGLNE